MWLYFAAALPVNHWESFHQSRWNCRRVHTKIIPRKHSNLCFQRPISKPKNMTVSLVPFFSLRFVEKNLKVRLKWLFCFQQQTKKKNKNITIENGLFQFSRLQRTLWCRYAVILIKTGQPYIAISIREIPGCFSFTSCKLCQSVWATATDNFWKAKPPSSFQRKNFSDKTVMHDFFQNVQLTVLNLAELTSFHSYSFVFDEKNNWVKFCYFVTDRCFEWADNYFLDKFFRNW